MGPGFTQNKFHPSYAVTATIVLGKNIKKTSNTHAATAADDAKNMRQSVLKIIFTDGAKRNACE